VDRVLSDNTIPRFFPQNGRIGYPVVYARIGIPRRGAPVPLVQALVTRASICKSKNTGLLSP